MSFFKVKEYKNRWNLYEDEVKKIVRTAALFQLTPIYFKNKKEAEIWCKHIPTNKLIFFIKWIEDEEVYKKAFEKVKDNPHIYAVIPEYDSLATHSLREKARERVKMAYATLSDEEAKWNFKKAIVLSSYELGKKMFPLKEWLELKEEIEAKI